MYRALCRDEKRPRARYALLRRVYRPDTGNGTGTGTGEDGDVLDSGALVLFFPAPKTVTGEDVLELQVHGGSAIVKAVLGAISSMNSVGSVVGSDTDTDTAGRGVIRYAEPGEFTRRAFLNSRLDLPQIEALGETLTADTEQQRRLAVRGTSTALTTRYEHWRVALLYARGELEALIDFAEDQHFDESAETFVASVAGQISALRGQIALHVENAARGELRRSGIRVALLGAPNAGKSSLLNRVVGREAAIVSTEEGTTRDIVDVGVDLGGWFCKVGDMAGIRGGSSSPDPEGSKAPRAIGVVEREGIRRARARALESDVVIVVVSLDDGGSGSGSHPPHLSIEQEVIDATNDCIEAGKRILIAVNKCDLLRTPLPIPGTLLQTLRGLFPSVPTERIFGISCQQQQAEPSPSQTATQTHTGTHNNDPGNLQSFLRGLITTFEDLSSPTGIQTDANGVYDTSYWEDSLGVTHRQSSNLEACLRYLDEFLAQTVPSSSSSSSFPLDSGVDVVTAAENLRAAADALAKITGRGESGDVEDVLGVVFEKYVPVLVVTVGLC